MLKIIEGKQMRAIKYVAIFLLFFTVTSLSQQSEFQTIGTWEKPGPISSIEVDSDKIYIGRGNHFRVLNVKNKKDPILISDYSMPATIQKIISTFNSNQNKKIAAIQCSKKGIYILDITDPTNISEVFNYYIGNITDFAISDDNKKIYAVATDKLVCINIADFQNPVVTELNNISGTHLQLTSEYLIVSKDDLFFYDINSLSSASVPKGFYKPVCSGMGSCSVSSDFFTVFNDTLYVSCNLTGTTLGHHYSFSEIQKVDFSQVTKPVLLTTLNGDWQDAVIQNNKAYAISENTLKIWDLTNNQVIGTYNNFNSANQIRIEEELVYLAANYDGVQIVDVSTPETPLLEGHIKTPANFLPADDMLVIGSTCYMIDLQFNNTNGGIRVIDISDESKPELKGSADIKETGYGEARILYHNKYLYGFSKTNLYVFDVTDDENPIRVDSIKIEGTILDQKITNGKLFLLTNNTPQLTIWDLSSPNKPVKTQSVETISDTKHIAFDEEENLLMLCSDNQVQITKISDIDQVLMTTELDCIIKDVAFNYPVLSIVDSKINGLSNYTVDLQNKSINQNGSYITTSSIYANKIISKDNFIFLHDYKEGIYAIDNSNIDNPVNISTYSIYDSRAFCVDHKNYLYVTKPNTGMMILKNNLITDIHIDYFDPSVPENFYISQNYPNPFNPSTVIQYEVPFETKVSIKIYNILGQEIKTLVNEQKEPGVYELKCNLERFQSGVYFYKITADRYSETKRMILLK